MAYGTVNADKVVSSDGVTSGGLYGFKNRIINGAMMIDQRNAGASVTPTNGAYTLDRWGVAASAASKFTVQQSSTAPAGFSKSLLVTSSSAYSVGASEIFAVQQSIEGLNMPDVGFGAAGASTLTLSFWVRSSLTGTFGGVLTNYANNRTYPFSYTISAANTFEQKTITITGDTSGTWLTTNSGWGQVWFGLGVGSTYSGTANSWSSSAYYSTTGATSVVGTSGATFYITGVQLEKGSTATSFDYRPYGTELALCSRYFQKSYNEEIAIGAVTTTGGITNQAQATVAYVPMTWNFPVKMRTTPTLSTYSTQTGTAGKFYSNAPAGDFNTSAGFIGATGATVTTGATSISATGYVVTQMTASAEL